MLRTTAQSRRLEHRLLRSIGRASQRYGLLEPGDRVMVAVSGGKDSQSLLHLLRELQRRAPFDFSLIAVNVNQMQPGFPEKLLPDYFAEEKYDFRIVDDDTYSIVREKMAPGQTFCSLCSRLRRGILYTVAAELGATKIALGHHREDFIETLLLNALYSGQLKAMPAKLRSDDGRNVVIRPMVYCAEADIARYAREKQFPLIPCSLCGSQPDLKRARIKRLIRDLSIENPHVPGNLLAALANVRPTQLLDNGLMTPVGSANSDIGEPTDSDHVDLVQLLPRASTPEIS